MTKKTDSSFYDDDDVVRCINITTTVPILQRLITILTTKTYLKREYERIARIINNKFFMLQVQGFI